MLLPSYLKKIFYFSGRVFFFGLICVYRINAQAQSYYNANVHVASGGQISDFGNDVFIGASGNVSIAGNMDIYAHRIGFDSLAVTTGSGSLKINNPASVSLPWTSHVLDANGGSVYVNIALNSTRLELDNFSAPLFAASPSAGVKLGGSLSFVQGKIYTNNHSFRFLPGSSHSGSDSDSYIYGTVAKIGNTGFVFPVGDDSLYAPIGISAPQSVSDEFAAKYYWANPRVTIGSAVDPFLHHISSSEYWELSRVVGSSAVAVSLYWDARSGGVVDPSLLHVAHWNGSLWEDKGNVSFQGTAASGNVTSATMANFSPFTLSSSSLVNPLPVSLADFGGDCEANHEVRLYWKTLSEQNNSGFTLEYSIDLQAWSPVGTLPGAGNSNEPVFYTFKHIPKRGIAYYRLWQQDYDGQKKAYGPISLTCGEEQKAPLLYPNPTETGQVWLLLPMSESVWKYGITDMRGVLVQQGELKGSEGPLPLSVQDLAAGTYFIRLSNASDFYTLPLFKILK